jgi:hypothetical protein
MNPTIDIDPASMRRLNETIAKFTTEIGLDSVKVLKDQGRLFVRDLIKVTPPFGDATFSESYNTQRKAGESAVERDIRKVFVPLRQFAENVSKTNPELGVTLTMKGGITGSNIANRKLKRSSNRIDMQALEAIFRNMGMEGRVMLNVDPAIHEKARGRRGRVRRATPVVVVNEKSIDKYIKEKQGHIGKAKAGFMKAAIGLAVKGIPNWIRRHMTPGVFRDQTGANNPNA